MKKIIFSGLIIVCINNITLANLSSEQRIEKNKRKQKEETRKQRYLFNLCERLNMFNNGESLSSKDPKNKICHICQQNKCLCTIRTICTKYFQVNPSLLTPLMQNSLKTYIFKMEEERLESENERLEKKIAQMRALNDFTNEQRIATAKLLQQSKKTLLDHKIKNIPAIHKTDKKESEEPEEFFSDSDWDVIKSPNS